jgi:hypothetical protein
MSAYVVTVATGGTPDLFGPFPSRAKAWEFADRVRRNRRRDHLMPAVGVQPIQPGRMTSVHLCT